jgi:type I restriction-modification system DNA methylase subunit
MEILNRQRLGLRDVEPDILGRAYEYLLREFAEGSGQSAGEFYTPKEVGTLMAYILDPEEGETVYDPCCGSGGLLIKSQLHLPHDLVEYVICHELVHVRVPEHGKGWQALMGIYLPDWREREQHLAGWVLRSI